MSVSGVKVIVQGQASATAVVATGVTANATVHGSKGRQG